MSWLHGPLHDDGGGAEVLHALINLLPNERRWSAASRARWLATITATINLLMTVEEPPRTAVTPTSRADWATPLVSNPQALVGPAHMPYEPLLETVLSVLEEAGGPLFFKDLWTRVQTRRKGGSIGWLQTVLYTYDHQEDSRLVRVAPSRWGLKGRDVVEVSRPRKMRQSAKTMVTDRSAQHPVVGSDEPTIEDDVEE